jgi:uncharacterized protein (TIGR03083 family)
MNAATILFYSNRSFMRALEGLDMADWTRPGVCGVWSVKDIVAHIASYEAMADDVLGLFTGKETRETLDQMAALRRDFNDAEVNRRADLTPQQVLDEYLQLHESVMARCKEIPAETLAQPGTIPWYGEEYALDDFLVYTQHGHKREHIGQIMVYRDLLKTERGE